MNELELKIKGLNEEIGSLSTQAEGIYEKAESEPRDLTDEETKQFDDLSDQIEAKQAEVARLEKRMEMADRNASERSTPSVQAPTKVGNDNGLGWMRRTVRFFNALVVGKEDSQRGAELMNALKREISSLPDAQLADEDKEALETVRNSGLSLVKQANLRAFFGLEERVQTTSTTDTPKTGYLLPKPFLAEVFVIIEQYGLARRLFRTIPMISGSLDLKNVVSKVVASWVDEAANGVGSELVLGEGQLLTKKLMGLTTWTSELEEDQAIALLPIVAELFGESMAEKEDEAGFLGDGTSGFGSFTGIANLTNAFYVTGSAGQTDATFLTEATLRAMKAGLSTARKRGAVWVMHETTWDVIAQFENTAGFRIVQENLTAEVPRQLLGHPVEFSDAFPTYGSVGADTPFITFGNYKRALMGQRRGVTMDISREAVLQAADGSIDYNAFQADGALLKMTERVGFKVPAAFESAFSVIQSAAA